ncbi:MAG: alanine dehydrogenase [Capnocytophaga sp.]|nr:alanine dehydrogenase [Capnocytophaga sp.]
MPSLISYPTFLPKEERLAVSNQHISLKIGLPKESTYQEKRICLAPDDVAVLVANGHRILVESEAGNAANFSDSDYSEAGAEIVYDTEKVFACPIVLKVEPPTEAEIKYLQHKAVLISALQIKTQTKAYFEALAQKQITALAFEYIQDQQRNHPVRQSMSEIIGIGSVLVASELVADTHTGGGLLFGNITGVPPIEVVFLGANGIVQAGVKAALGLGAKVKVFDRSLADLRKLKNHVGESVFTSTLQPKILNKALMRCNVLIGAMFGEKRSPIVVNETMVKLMKKGAVIVDASIDTGGCIETSRITTLAKPTFVKHSVIHYCVPNMASRYARTASLTLSNIMMPYLLQIGEEGGMENILHTDVGLRSGLYFYHGILTDSTVSQWFGLPYQPINLLFI